MPPPTGRSRSRDGERLNLARRHGCRRAVQDTSCSSPSTRYASPVCLAPTGFPNSVPPACSISTAQNPGRFLALIDFHPRTGFQLINLFAREFPITLKSLHRIKDVSIDLIGQSLLFEALY